MLTARKLNTFTFFKLPSAYFTGVRVIEIDAHQCKVGVRHRWINQNPFGSLYFAVQAMAAELSTGALVISHIQDSGKNVSMLVARNESVFTKKAKGKIIFECSDGDLAKQSIDEAVKTGEGKTFWMESAGRDQAGDIVATFRFEWTVKLKKG
jgi:hypothetical protein